MTKLRMLGRGWVRWSWAGAALAAMALLAKALATGWDRQGAGVDAGIGPQIAAAGPAAANGDMTNVDLANTDMNDRRLVVGQFNIRRGLGPDLSGLADFWQMAACLTGLDVAGLNEVDGGLPFGLRGNQAASLGRMLGLGSIFAPAERRFWHGHIGNALLSARPVHGWVRLPLPFDAGPAHRNMLYAQIGAAADPIRLIVTHIDRKADGDRQLAEALGFFLFLEPPVVLVGDLNVTMDNPRIAEILARPDVVASNGWHPPRPAPGRVDWILARGFRAGEASQCDVGASDHPRIALELERLP